MVFNVCKIMTTLTFRLINPTSQCYLVVGLHLTLKIYRHTYILHHYSTYQRTIAAKQLNKITAMQNV